MTRDPSEARLAGERPDAPASDDEALIRLIREGVRPRGIGDRFSLILRKLSGDVPMGIDAPSKKARKWIGGSHELLGVVRFVLIGLLALPVGLLVLVVGLTGERDALLLGIGAAFTVVGAWSLRSARDALRRLRAISRA